MIPPVLTSRSVLASPSIRWFGEIHDRRVHRIPDSRGRQDRFRGRLPACRRGRASLLRGAPPGGAEGAFDELAARQSAGLSGLGVSCAVGVQYLSKTTRARRHVYGQSRRDACSSRLSGQVLAALYGRATEQSVIDRLLVDACAGRSGALVVRGEPGIGKTALLDCAAVAAGAVAAGDGVSSCATPGEVVQPGMAALRVIRGAGVESEAELPFVGCTCCSGRRWIGASRSPSHSATRWLRRSGCGTPGPTTVSSSASLCFRCWPSSPRTDRLCAWSTTHSGWIGPRPRRWCSRPGGWAPRGSR